MNLFLHFCIPVVSYGAEQQTDDDDHVCCFGVKRLTVTVCVEHLHFASCGVAATQQSCRCSVTHLMNLFDKMH